MIPLNLAAADGGEAITVCGSDYETVDGSCVRDFVHVCDIADAHLRALEYLMTGGTGCALNLANACGVSVKEVIATAARVSGPPARTWTSDHRRLELDEKPAPVANPGGMTYHYGVFS